MTVCGRLQERTHRTAVGPRVATAPACGLLQGFGWSDAVAATLGTRMLSCWCASVVWLFRRLEKQASAKPYQQAP